MHDTMGAIKVILSDDLEEKFREEVFKSKGMKKGNLTKAIEEAVTAWIKTQQEKRSNAAKKAWETRRKK
jgi:hypothetical protein